jgi:adenosylcobinamide-GDP ribazoletransferase
MARRQWSPEVAAALVIAGELAITGMLHFDGLVDAADGLLSQLDRHRRLEVMDTPDIGAFGLAAGVGTLLVRYASLVSLAPSVPLLAGMVGMSRTVMATVAKTRSYARVEGGLATAFGAVPSRSRPPLAKLAPQIASAAGALVLGAIGGTCGEGARGRCLLPVVVVAATSFGVVLMAERRIGGFTGDVLGAAGALGETAALVAAARRSSR